MPAWSTASPTCRRRAVPFSNGWRAASCREWQPCESISSSGLADAGGRQPHRHGRAVPDDAVDGEGAAMELRHGIAERQAEPRAFVFAVELAVDLAEGRECGGDVLGGDADAGVGDADEEVAVAIEPRRHLDTAAGRGELHGVGQQVEQNLLQLSLVGEERRQIVGQAEMDCNLAALRALL